MGPETTQRLCLTIHNNLDKGDITFKNLISIRYVLILQSFESNPYLTKRLVASHMKSAKIYAFYPQKTSKKSISNPATASWYPSAEAQHSELELRACLTSTSSMGTALPRSTGMDPGIGLIISFTSRARIMSIIPWRPQFLRMKVCSELSRSMWEALRRVRAHLVAFLCCAYGDLLLYFEEGACVARHKQGVFGW